jgi:hypothetical protein
MHFVSLKACFAGLSGSVEHQAPASEPFHLRLCLFLAVCADYCGTLFDPSPGCLHFTSSNVSDSRARKCVGCMEVNYGYLLVQETVFYRCTALAHNGGICTRVLDSMDITRCLFVNGSHCSSDSRAAAALLVHDNPEDSGVLHTQFLGNHANASFVVTVFSGFPLIFDDCFFSGTRTSELNSRNVLLGNTNFEVTDFEEMSVGKFAGFNDAVTMMPATREVGGTWKGIVGDDYLFVISGIASAIIAGILTLGHATLLHFFKSWGPLPHALRKEHARKSGTV